MLTDVLRYCCLNHGKQVKVLNMTPETLHQRILLHELRTILLDETREGTQVPGGFAGLIREIPHKTEPYLILADWFDEQGDPLGELCRIQCELIGELPECNWCESRTYFDHPFLEDCKLIQDLPVPDVFGWVNKQEPLVKRRWEIVKGFYPDRVCYFSMSEAQRFDLDRPWTPGTDHDNNRWIYTQTRKLGRTTRMLTDVLRYCCLNHGNRILLKHKTEIDTIELGLRFFDVARELGSPVEPTDRIDVCQTINENTIEFSGILGGIFDIISDITFTDHAVLQ